MFEFGESFYLRGADVATVIGDRIWPTILLLGTSTIASAIIGLIIGIYGVAARSKFDVDPQLHPVRLRHAGVLVRDPRADGLRGRRGTLPRDLPNRRVRDARADLGAWAHVTDVEPLFLPWMVLTIAYLGQYALIMRNSVIDVMNDDFVQTARAKGVREKQVLRHHVVPNALLPTMTLILLSLGFIFGGAITIEYVFSYPGLGLLTVQAIDAKDYPLLQGLFLLFSAAVILANLIADVLYSYLDPRVRAA